MTQGRALDVSFQTRGGGLDIGEGQAHGENYRSDAAGNLTAGRVHRNPRIRSSRRMALPGSSETGPSGRRSATPRRP